MPIDPVLAARLAQQSVANTGPQLGQYMLGQIPNSPMGYPGAPAQLALPRVAGPGLPRFTGATSAWPGAGAAGPIAGAERAAVGALGPAGGVVGGAAGAGLGAAEQAAGQIAVGSGGRLAGAASSAFWNVPKLWSKAGAARLGTGLALSYGGNMLGEALGGSDTLQGRITKGAAKGAGLGIIGGPWGAAAGGALGGLYGGVFGKAPKKVNYKLKLQDAISTMGLPPEIQANLMQQYTARVKVFGNTKENKEATANAIAEAGLAAMQEMSAQGQTQGAYGGAYDAQNAANGYGPLNSANGLRGQAALQLQAAQFMQPYADQVRMDATNQAAYLSNAAASLPPAYRSVAQAGAIGNMTAANQMATAYQASAALAPATAAYEEQLKKFNAAGNALYGQALSNQLNPPAAAAGQLDLSSIISR